MNLSPNKAKITIMEDKNKIKTIYLISRFFEILSVFAGIIIVGNIITAVSLYLWKPDRICASTECMIRLREIYWIMNHYATVVIPLLSIIPVSIMIISLIISNFLDRKYKIKQNKRIRQNQGIIKDQLKTHRNEVIPYY